MVLTPSLILQTLSCIAGDRTRLEALLADLKDAGIAVTSKRLSSIAPIVNRAGQKRLTSVGGPCIEAGFAARYWEKPCSRRP